ncbi:MAG: 2-dehydropantoate 2-reductase [Synergistaceae bacterium]|jgi:2-dehydropantoate 2-reductase|nr:2-dehydropantoate 2-reductase [Synergistaceae bacterium]
MKYLVIGAGGTGGCIAGFMARAGMDVSLIARGDHLRAIQNEGLVLLTTIDGRVRVPLSSYSEDEYADRPDVVFVCVKTYSIDEIAPFLRRICGAETIVIPIQNSVGTGDRIERLVPDAKVLDGCIYIGAEKLAPGEIRQNGKFFRVVFGMRGGEAPLPQLETVKNDLEKSGIRVVVSDNIAMEVLLKLSFVSPFAAASAYYDGAPTDKIASDPEKMKLFTDLIEDIDRLAKALRITFDVNLVEHNQKIMYAMPPGGTASLQKDLNRGGRSEVDTMIYDLLRLGAERGASMPAYEKVASRLKERN